MQTAVADVTILDFDGPIARPRIRGGNPRQPFPLTLQSEAARLQLGKLRYLRIIQPANIIRQIGFGYRPQIDSYLWHCLVLQRTAGFYQAAWEKKEKPQALSICLWSLKSFGVPFMDLDSYGGPPGISARCRSVSTDAPMPRIIFLVNVNICPKSSSVVSTM